MYNILEIIDDAYNAFITSTGRAPRKGLYLGEIQHEALDAAMATLPAVHAQSAENAGRRRYLNIPVYRVDANDHLQFA